jgi:hypothetical protein
MSKTNPENGDNKKNKPKARGPNPKPRVEGKAVGVKGDKVNKLEPKPENQSRPKTKRPAPEPQSPPGSTEKTNDKSEETLLNADSKLSQRDSLEQTEQMEVHHHPQLEHKPKPWKEYVLECFMIFVAVMMGFIAENIRDDINNNEHAKQLTSQLVQELKADTAKLNACFKGETGIMKSNDTLFKLLQQPLAKADLKKIQRFIAASHSLWPFHPSTGAITAIKNELHLKQFSDSEIISFISKYETHIGLLNIVQGITLEYQRNFLDPFLYQHFTPTNLDAAFAKSPDLNTQMRNLTQENITQLAAQMILVRINSKELIDDNRRCMNDAVNLLNYVTKQYHLED